jgi:outer membrane protein OmpA-like peptidoglycan-associated protein
MSRSLSLALALVAAPGVVDIELPVVDLQYQTASLDNSVQTAESSKQVKVTLAADVLFKFDKAVLSPRARARLAEVTARISQADPQRIKIDGYTDSKGSNAYNLGLSRRRAAAVAAAVRERLGGATPRLVVRGHGEADPVAANTRKDGSDNPQGRARNRRVTIVFPR